MVVPVLVLAAFGGASDPADHITASSARLKAHGLCQESACDVYLEWGPCTRPVLELVCTYAERETWEDVAAGPDVEMPIVHEVTGLEPGTPYRYRLCGKGADQPDGEYACTGERDFVTGSDSAAPPSPLYRLGSIEQAGSLSHAQGSHQGRDVGAAVELGGRLLWFFGDTALTVTAVDGSNWRTSTAAHGPTGPLSGDYPALDDASAPSEHLDGNGAPAQFVPYSASEPEFVQVGDQNRHYFHWPIYGFPRVVDGQEEALIFFSRGVFFADTPAVTYVDVLRGGVATTGSADRRILWDPAGPNGDRYFPIDVEEEGFRYFASGKRTNGGFTSRIFLARVPPDQATDPSAYRYWNPASGSWQPEQISPACGPSACPVEGIIEVSAFADYHTSISWNPYLEQYLLVAGNGGGAALHVADSLTGPWSVGTDIPATADGAYGFLTSTATMGLPNYHARETVQLRSADGRTIVMSYLHATDEGPENRAVKLLRLTLERADKDDGVDEDPGDGDPDDPSSDDATSTCGCGAAGGSPAPAWLAALAILTAARRRRRR